MFWIGELVLPGAGAGANGGADSPRRRDDHRNKQEQRPAEPASQRNHQRHGRDKREELLQEIAQHRTDRHLHPIHIVDKRRKNSARRMAMEEAGRATNDGFVQVIAHIGHHAEARVIHQVRARVVAEAFDDGRADEQNSDHSPRIVHMHPRRNELMHIELPPGRSKREERQRA